MKLIIKYKKYLKFDDEKIVGVSGVNLILFRKMEPLSSMSGEATARC